jgi:hypothetical protein
LDLVIQCRSGSSKKSSKVSGSPSVAEAIGAAEASSDNEASESLSMVFDEMKALQTAASHPWLPPPSPLMFTKLGRFLKPFKGPKYRNLNAIVGLLGDACDFSTRFCRRKMY